MSRGIFNRDIQQVKNLLNSPYNDIFVILKESDKDLTITEINLKHNFRKELNPEPNKKGYRHTWKHIQLLKKIGIVTTYEKGNTEYVKLIKNFGDLGLTEAVTRLNPKGVISEVLNTGISLKKFKKKTHEGVEKFFEDNK